MKLKILTICILTVFIGMGSGRASPVTQASECQANVSALREKVSRLEGDGEVLKTEIRYLNKTIDDRTLWIVGTFVFLVGFLGFGSISAIRRSLMEQLRTELKDEIREQHLHQQILSELQKYRESERRAKEAKSDEDALKRIEELEKFGAGAVRSNTSNDEDQR